MAVLVPGLHASLLLAGGRADALTLLPAPDGRAGADRPLPDPLAHDVWTGARQSFWAAALCLPAFIFLHLLEWFQTGTAMPTARGFAGDLTGFAVGWMGFAVLTHALAGRLGRAAHWPRFITLWNWCNLVQYMMLVAASLPALLGLPAIVGQTAWLAAIGWALWLEWFMTGLALDLRGSAAAALVAADVAIGLLIGGLTGSAG